MCELEAGNLNEVVSAVLQPRILIPVTHLIINRNAWESVPEETRTAIQDALEAAHADIAAQYEAVDSEAIQAAMEYGVEFVELPEAEIDKLNAAAAGFWDEVEGASPNAGEAIALYRAYLAR